jgi:hypothetical protein
MTIPRSCINCFHHIHLEGVFTDKHICYEPRVIEQCSPIDGTGVPCKTARGDSFRSACYKGDHFHPKKAKGPPHPDELVRSVCGKPSTSDLSFNGWFYSCHKSPTKAQHE